MKVLIAEDDLFYRCLVESTLREWGYEVVSVSDGAAAWEILKRPDAPKLAILDWLMPGMDGLTVCRKVRANFSAEPTHIILLTCREGKDNVVTALEAGADDYLTNPFDREELRARLQVGRRVVGLQTSLTVVFSLARAVEAKSPYTQGHAERVTQHALRLAARVGVSERDRQTLHQGGLLHDIGKIAVPDAILDKPGAVTREEFEILKRHTTEGARIIEPLQSLVEVLPLVRSHHERLDGTGYPDGLKRDEIPFLVRILSVADVYDALASARPYRGAMPHDKCLSILFDEGRKGWLDADLVRDFELTFGSTPSKQGVPIEPLPVAVTASRTNVPRISPVPVGQG